MVFDHNIIGVILSQLEQCCLAYLQQLGVNTVGLRFVGEGVEENEGIENEPEEAECIAFEVGE